MSTSDRAKETVSSLFSKTRVTVARAKQQVLAKLGKGEETVDITFNQERERLLAHYEAIKKINKDTQKMLDILRDLSACETTLAQDFYDLYDPQASLYNAALKNQDIAKLLDTERIQFDEQIHKDFIEPISKYLAQFKEIKQRIEVRHTRRVDMDRYAHEVKNLNEKGNHFKLPLAEEKYNNARTSYNALNEELLKDMPALFDDRIAFFDPIFATYLTSVAELYRQAAKITAEAIGLVAQVDREAVHSHPRVITPTEKSAAIKRPMPHSTTISPDDRRKSLGTSLSSSSFKNADESSVSDPSTVEEVGSNRTSAAANRRKSSFVLNASAPPSDSQRKQALPNTPKRQQARANYDFTAQEDNELSFHTGDVLTVRNKNGEWWECELNGKTGLIPGNYVELLN
jgi:amphiphysin